MAEDEGAKMVSFVSAKGPEEVSSASVGQQVDTASLRRITATKTFLSPNGDKAWGAKLFASGLGIDACKNREMRQGWTEASKKS